MWPTEPPTTISTPFIEMPHRELAAPSSSTATPVPGGAHRLRGVSPGAGDARHDVFGEPGADVAVDGDRRLHVHAGTVVADVALDFDIQGLRQADGQGVGTILDDDATETVVFSDSFEVSEWNGLWVEDSQNDWFRSTQRASEGSCSASWVFRRDPPRPR